MGCKVQQRHPGCPMSRHATCTTMRNLEEQNPEYCKFLCCMFVNQDIQCQLTTKLIPKICCFLCLLMQIHANISSTLQWQNKFTRQNQGQCMKVSVEYLEEAPVLSTSRLHTFHQQYQKRCTQHSPTELYVPIHAHQMNDKI